MVKIESNRKQIVAGISLPKFFYQLEIRVQIEMGTLLTLSQPY